MSGPRLLLAAATAALLIALPTAAHAATTASVADRVLTVESTTPGEVNDLSVDMFVHMTVTDAGGAAVVAGPGCKSSGNAVTCGYEIDAIVIRTGPGNDIVRPGTTGSWERTIEGGDGDDTLSGALGDDVIEGGAGIDTISGGDGTDRIEGGVGNDVLAGGGSHDTFVQTGSYGDGADTVDGGTGIDVIDYGARQGAVRVDLPGDEGTTRTSGDVEHAERDVLSGVDGAVGGNGDDVLAGAATRSWLTGGSGDDTLTGAGGEDNLVGGPGADDLDGGDDEDYLYARDGETDVLACGSGDDHVEADNGRDGVTSCEMVAPQFASRPGLSRLEAGRAVSITGTPTGTASESEVSWFVCEDVAALTCVDRGTAPTLTLTDADLGRFVYADVVVWNDAGEDRASTAVAGPVVPFKEDAKPVEQETPRDEDKPAPPAPPVASPGPSPAPEPAPIVTPRAAVTAPADPFLAAARRLLGSAARAAGAIGPVRAYTAPGRGIALVCTKRRCVVRAGSKRLTLTAAKPRRIKARKGAKLRITVGKTERTLRAA